MIKVLDKEWSVRPISFKQRRKLFHLHSASFIDPKLQGQDFSWDKFAEAMEFALEIAFVDVEKTCEGMSDLDIDTLAQAVLNHYLIEKK